jgi:hypothetical protein
MLVAIGILFVVGLPDAVAVEPPFPTIVLMGPKDENNHVGQLLAHADSFWYLIDKRGTVLAILDSAVENVRVSHKGSQRNSSVHR